MGRLATPWEKPFGMASNSDTGLVKRGFILLGLMALLVTTVLFILLQRPRTAAPAAALRAEDYAWAVAAPTAGFPANVSWGALYELSGYMPSPVGWEVRYNAAATLARRGSDRVPWTVFREMLDVKRTTANLQQQLTDGQESPEASARDLVMIGLKALAEWHAKRRTAGDTAVPSGLPAVYAAVDRLAGNSDPQLRELAQKTREGFFRD